VLAARRGTVYVAGEGSTVFKKDGAAAIFIFGMACTPEPEKRHGRSIPTKVPSAHVPVRLAMLARNCIANVHLNKHL
jgi:hypothetical protein